MFSKSCEYGIRALTIIAKAHEQDKKIGIKEICRISNSPESFTAKILQNLVRQNILASQKGPSGGFYFKRKLEDISLIEIINIIDGDAIFNKCGLGLSHCDAKNPCPLHYQYEKVRDELIEMCQNSNLKDLAGDLKPSIYDR